MERTIKRGENRVRLIDAQCRRVRSEWIPQFFQQRSYVEYFNISYRITFLLRASKQTVSRINALYSRGCETFLANERSSSDTFSFAPLLAVVSPMQSNIDSPFCKCENSPVILITEPFTLIIESPAIERARIRNAALR